MRIYQLWVMQVNDDILDLLRGKAALAVQRAQRGVILQPGAIGDCLLTIPLAGLIKDSLAPGGVDIFGRSEYIGILPGRTVIDGIRSLDSMNLHRLFVETKEFDPVDGDALIELFADYSWIVSFLGEPGSDFEQNLIFTAHCSHSAEVITLAAKPAKKFSGHISEFYREQFISQCGLSLGRRRFCPEQVIIKADESDVNRGRELLREIGCCENPVIVHPGSGGMEKCWHLDNFLAVAEELVSRGIRVIFLLGPAEMDRFSRAQIKDISSVARFISGLSLTEVLALLSCAGGFIGNDSGITHLSAGLGVRTVAVFGPSAPVVYRPIGPAVTLIADSSAAFSERPTPALQQRLLEVL